jgi:hypothetical protein
VHRVAAIREGGMGVIGAQSKERMRKRLRKKIGIACSGVGSRSMMPNVMVRGRSEGQQKGESWKAAKKLFATFASVATEYWYQCASWLRSTTFVKGP